MVEKIPFIIGGQKRTSQELVEVRFPYNNELVAQVYQANDDHLEGAVQSALRGFEITRKLPSHARSRILYNLLDQMEKRTEELVQVLVMEGGKTQNVARGEVTRAKETVRVAAEEAKRISGEIVPIDWTEAGEGRLGFVRRLPMYLAMRVVPPHPGVIPLSISGMPHTARSVAMTKSEAMVISSPPPTA